MKGTLLYPDGNGVAAVYLPPEEKPVTAAVYCLMGHDFAETLEEVMTAVEPAFGKGCLPFGLALLSPESWDDDYTPWPAEMGGRHFGGQADRFLERFLKEQKPAIEQEYGWKNTPETTAVVGYSLGGLAALYAFYQSGAFGRVGSASGSLWYPGWMDYMRAQTPARESVVYLSLGSKEEKTKNPWMAQVGDATREAKAIFDRALIRPGRCTLEWNSGGHFSGIPARIEKMLLRLMEESR